MNELSTALWITGIGMGLVFAAIILLWGMMILLTALTQEKESGSDSAEAVSLTPSPSPTGRGETLARAAAIAVAMALAEQGPLHSFIEPPTALVSAWQLGMRTRQMYEKGGR